jgi:hypothetical protein
MTTETPDSNFKQREDMRPHCRGAMRLTSDSPSWRTDGAGEPKALLIQAEADRHRFYEQCFNGDGAVVSYLQQCPQNTGDNYETSS